MSKRDQSKADPVFDTLAAAPLLGVKPGTLEVWRCQGRGPRFVKSGARVVYRLRDMNEYLDNRTRKSTADPGPVGGVETPLQPAESPASNPDHHETRVPLPTPGNPKRNSKPPRCK